MIEILIFLIIIFLYIQIVRQYTSTDDLDIYEIDYYDNNNMQETCKMCQPFVFSYKEIFPKLEIDSPLNLIVYKKDDSFRPFQIPTSTANQLFLMDTSSNYYSETTGDFLQPIHILDTFLKPPFTIQSSYALLMGSIGCTTPFLHHRNSLRFLLVQKGTVCLKMAPWKKNKKNLYEIYDSHSGIIRSPIDVWNPSPQYYKSWNKINFVNVTLKEGQLLFIPSFWGYSIKYQESAEIFEITYSTFFNRIAFLNEIIFSWLQKENTTYKVWPTISNKEDTDISGNTVTSQEEIL